MMRLPVLFARREFRDERLRALGYAGPILKKHLDTVLYADAGATIQVSQRVWWQRPDKKGARTTNHNCSKYELVWLPDLPVPEVQ
jgi:hypothetical protein